MFEVWLEYLGKQTKTAIEGLQAVTKRTSVPCLDIRKLGLRKNADLRKVVNV
jgi:hypothetical protein